MPSSGAGSETEEDSFNPRGMAKVVTCLTILRLPHLGQTGERSSRSFRDRKLNIFRQSGQANS
jgi:hypothetical protein